MIKLRDLSREARGILAKAIPYQKLEAPTSNKDYMQLFAKWRNKHRIDGEWSTHGVDYLAVVNAAIADSKNHYPDTKEGYEELRAKHNSTRMNYRKKIEAPIIVEFNITEWRKVKNKKVAVVAHLSDDRQSGYAKAMLEAGKLIDSKMPSLPPYDGTGRVSATGEDMTGWLD